MHWPNRAPNFILRKIKKPLFALTNKSFENAIFPGIFKTARVVPEFKVEYKLLYVIVMTRMRFRVNLQFPVAWMSRNSLLETGTISEVYVTVTGFEPTTT